MCLTQGHNTQYYIFLVWKRAIAWDLREMGSAWGKRGEGGPGPPEKLKDKQLMPNKGRDNMGKDNDDQPSRSDEGGSARTE